MTLIWEENIAEDGVAEVHLGEVEGATPVPDTQPTAPDTRPLPEATPEESEAPTPAPEPVTPAAAEPPAPPADPFHGLPPIRELEDDEETFAAAVPKQPSADLPAEPVIVPAPAPATTRKPESEKHDSVWMRHEPDPHTQFAPVPRRHGNHVRRTHDEHAGATGPTPQRTLTGAPRPRKARGPNHGVSAATLDFLRAAQAREQVRKSSGRRALARMAIGLLVVTAIAQRCSFSAARKSLAACRPPARCGNRSASRCIANSPHRVTWMRCRSNRHNCNARRGTRPTSTC